MKPPTVDKLTSQPKTVLAPFETVMKVNRENADYSCRILARIPTCRNKKKQTHAKSDSDKWKSGFRDFTEDLWGLTADGKAEQDTRGCEQVATSGRKGTGENRGIDDVGEDLDSSAIDGNDVRTEGGCWGSESNRRGRGVHL